MLRCEYLHKHRLMFTYNIFCRSDAEFGPKRTGIVQVRAAYAADGIIPAIAAVTDMPFVIIHCSFVSKIMQNWSQQSLSNLQHRLATVLGWSCTFRAGVHITGTENVKYWCMYLCLSIICQVAAPWNSLKFDYDECRYSSRSEDVVLRTAC